MFIEENPIINFDDSIIRQDGISAFMRIKNGEDYLKASILSIINQIDELICVFNGCTDNTEKILLKLEKQYPTKMKVYKYIPEVYPVNSEKYLNTEEDSVHSLVYYYNFALSKTTKKYCMKLDDDQIYFSNKLLELKKEMDLSKENYTIGIKGINLFDFKNELYVNLSDECTSGGDILFFKYNNTCCFKKDSKFETFVTSDVINRLETLFYHTKRCKKDRGINNYLLNDNPNSRYNTINIDYFKNLNPININNYLKDKAFNNPNTLGFEYINNSNKIYDSNVFSILEKKVIIPQNQIVKKSIPNNLLLRIKRS
jgi:glycosyltransferase involved in cell wall biosynthesis